MSGRRVIMVTRRFWPLMGTRESATADLAGELMGRGWRPSFLTTRFDRHWPSRVVFREMAVRRLDLPHHWGWGTIRYVIALARWLRHNQTDFDVVCVSGLSLEAHATVRAFPEGRMPVVLRAEIDEPQVAGVTERMARLARQLTGRFELSSAVVVSSEAARRRLCEVGFPDRSLHEIRDGVASAEPRFQANKSSARSSLASANGDLRVGLGTPVVVYIGPLRREFNLDQLIRGWRRLAHQHPHARLWLIGDGKDRQRLYREIQDADLVGQVLMPGNFDDLEDVMRASDLLVVPSAGMDQSATVLRAMAERLPVLVADSVEHRNVVRHGVTGRLLGQTGARGIADSLSAALAAPQAGEDMAAAAFAFAQQHHSRQAMGQHYQDLFEHLISSARRMVS